MPFSKHHIAIYNPALHFVEGIESHTKEDKYRIRLWLYDLQCQGYGYHNGYKIYDSTEAPFSWPDETVESTTEPTTTEETNA